MQEVELAGESFGSSLRGGTCDLGGADRDPGDSRSGGLGQAYRGPADATPDIQDLAAGAQWECIDEQVGEAVAGQRYRLVGADGRGLIGRP